MFKGNPELSNLLLNLPLTPLSCEEFITMLVSTRIGNHIWAFLLIYVPPSQPGRASWRKANKNIIQLIGLGYDGNP